MSRMIQLSLWDEAPTEDVQVQGIPEVVYLPHHWADGDEDPDQLVRLSHAILGDISMFDRSDSKVKEVYKIVCTGIVDGQVVAAYEHICNSREFYGGSSETQSSYEDEEDEF
jgi:hypothetical protein